MHASFPPLSRRSVPGSMQISWLSTGTLPPRGFPHRLSSLQPLPLPSPKKERRARDLGRFYSSHTRKTSLLASPCLANHFHITTWPNPLGPPSSFAVYAPNLKLRPVIQFEKAGDEYIKKCHFLSIGMPLGPILKIFYMRSSVFLGLSGRKG